MCTITMYESWPFCLNFTTKACATVFSLDVLWIPLCPIIILLYFPPSTAIVGVAIGKPTGAG